MPTFIDLFAGAGGFSEGFLQVEYDSKYYDFLLASDINTTCEVNSSGKLSSLGCCCFNVSIAIDLSPVNNSLSGKVTANKSTSEAESIPLKDIALWSESILEGPINTTVLELHRQRLR